MARFTKAINRATAFRSIIFLAAAMLVAAVSIDRAYTQSKAPYDKERLLKVVRLNALSTQEVVQAIEQRGVDFRMTPAIESEFQQAGARPEMIDTMRKNYRGAPAASTPAASSTTAPTRPTNTSRPSAGVPPGPPLSKSEIVTMLQGGLPAARVEQFVEVRGVSFTLTPEISREITAAGGNRSLLGAISEKATAESPSSGDPSSIANSPSRGRPAGPDYDDLTDQAIAALQSNNSPYAIRLLQQAVTMEPNKPTAFQLLGFAQLYGSRDALSADRSMRAAIERGGSAAFYVYHDHDKLFGSFCEGSLFVTKQGVTFKAKDGNHTFEALDSQIKETGLNGFVGAEHGAFHIKVYQDANRKDSKTYNFAPLTRQKAESNLIMSLIKSY
ncbi:MAG TPA: hypothetical protein VJQ56_06945 [Blastocatellia bacterium]|nr:hypothetical protein [Blastocatellia bacterium]